MRRLFRMPVNRGLMLSHLEGIIDFTVIGQRDHRLLAPLNRSQGVGSWAARVQYKRPSVQTERKNTTSLSGACRG
jgi:hypothetical protein